MLLTLFPALAGLGLFLAILICADLGRRIGVAQRAGDEDGPAQGSGATEAAVLGLLGLLLAFTFAGAWSRFEDRRQLVTEETNRIGTAWLRLDLLPEDARPELRTLFRRYTDLRATLFSGIRDLARAEALHDESAQLQKAIWEKALLAVRGPASPPFAALLLIPALNETFDITTTRLMATRNHPPLVIFGLLGGISLVGALMVGHGAAANPGRRWFHPVIFAAMLSLTVSVIVDLEFPRLGLIRVDAADAALIELRRSME